jgi:hypothetical protein
VRDKIFGSIDKLSRRFMEKYVSHIVTFSRVPEIFGIKTITIDNGIDIKRLKVLPAAKKEGALQLLGLANLSFWHGYDRVISGIAEYIRNSGSREVTFKIIGTGNELARLQEISRKLGVESYIMFTGGLHGDELNEAMLGCHIGISSIGMHRLNVDTSNLKSREFCARGLPFVIAYNDRDFPPDFPFVFYAPASDEPLDIKALINFYDTLRDNYPDYQEVMRAYSTNRLTWHAKLAPVSDLIQKHLSSVVK